MVPHSGDFGKPPPGLATLYPCAPGLFGGGLLATPLDDAIHQAVLHGFLGAHEAVAVGILLYLLQGLPRVLGQDVVEPLAHTEDFARVNFDIRLLALHAARGLMDHHARERQTVALATGSTGE